MSIETCSNCGIVFDLDSEDDSFGEEEEVLCEDCQEMLIEEEQEFHED